MSARKNNPAGGDPQRDEARIGGKIPGRNITEQSDIEQTRVENRRAADLEDKTPAGDGGPEDNFREESDDERNEEKVY
jgi:hypothetical protein